ncbi:phage tail tip lysozyme [Streptococcus suis]|uniref:phage tail tip lysozyme n=1 Tax=Streptococcus suis TaxID=1307 RepID=UPI00301014B6
MYDSDPKQLRKEGRLRVKKQTKEMKGQVPKTARLDARSTYQRAKKTYKQAKKDYRLHKGPKPTARALYFKKELDKAKVDKQVAKTIYKRSKKADSTYIPNRIKRRGKQGAYIKTRQDAEKVIRDNDILDDWVKGRQNIRQLRYQKATSQRALHSGKELGKYTIKQSYAQANRAYNFTRGRGFTRTPKEFSWEYKLSKRVKNVRHRLAQTKAGKVAKGTTTVLRVASNPIRTVLTNPLAIKSYFILFLLLGIISLFMGIFAGSGPVQQNEFDLNQSWLQVSKRDREKSTDTVDYWTNIDDVLFFMNYRYGSEWNPESPWKEGLGGDVSALLGFNHYSDALDDIWNHLNSDPHNLKTMLDLTDSSSSLQWTKLGKTEQKEYEELINLSKEVGRYPLYQELANPFSTENEDTRGQPLVILKRFGYNSPTELYDKTQLKATAGQTLRAPLAGKVAISGTQVRISTKEAIFTYEAVGGIRVKDQSSVTVGEEIGKVTTDGYQEIRYQKREAEATTRTPEKWTAVNPGFYFSSVTYNQTTSVLTTLEGDLGQKSRRIRDYLKPKLPNLTDNGLSAMLGNFATESNITAKRAEGDYLSPPVGVSTSSWDDPAWLDMGGPSIYNGSYPNILKRGLGLGQWTDTADGSVRHTLLRQYAQQKGKKWYDLELQLDFMLEGDSPYYVTIAKEILTSNEDVTTLTQRFLHQWEGNAGDKLLERQHNAKQIHTFLTQQIVGEGGVASSWNFPEAYRSQVTIFPSQAALTTQAGSGYPPGQCTWYSYNRLVELGSITDLSGSYGYLGNGQDWVRNLVAKGWSYSMTPTKGAVVSTVGGFDGTPPQYGHVGIVEAVNPDGSFLVSECNWGGVQDKIHWRVCRPAPYYSFAKPK